MALHWRSSLSGGHQHGLLLQLLPGRLSFPPTLDVPGALRGHRAWFKTFPGGFSTVSLKIVPVFSDLGSFTLQHACGFQPEKPTLSSLGLHVLKILKLPT